jgi:hypothetical protein
MSSERMLQADRQMTLHEEADEVLLQSLVASNKRSDEKKCDFVVTPCQR